MLLSVDNVAKSFGVQEVFRGVTLAVAKGDKIGLVGVNGCGKSTLMKCILAPDTIDAGSVRYAPAVRLGYVEQGFGSIGVGSVWDYMLTSCRDIVLSAEKLKELEAKASCAQGTLQQELLTQYARAEANFATLDGYHYEENIKKILFGLGFGEAMWQQSASALSGGQKTRLMLAGALVNSPELLLLDEPTNHLDIKMTEWLEQFLTAYKGGLLVVSHDRYFLDKVTTKTLEMAGGKLKAYKGNYSHYLEQKEIETASYAASYAAQQEYIERTEAYIRRFKAGIKSKMARGRQSQLNRLERLDAPIEEEEFSLRLPPAASCAERVLEMQDLTVGYGTKALATGINLLLKKGEKVALIGANGTGKTTLLKTILGEIPALGGEAKIGSRVKIGYFSQSYERLKVEQTILDNFLTEYGFTEQQTRNLLGGMLFHGDDVFKTIGTLSGGQKARLVLLKLVLDGANCLLLDEPTNHLDIAAKEAVEAALSIYDGAVLLVTHDRYLVNEVAEMVWELSDGTIHDYKGNYDYYLTHRVPGASDAAATTHTTATPKAKPTGRNTQAQPKQERALQNTTNNKVSSSSEASAERLAKIELRIREEEALLHYLGQKLSDPNCQGDLAASKAMAEEYAAQEAVVDKLMEQWEELMLLAEGNEE